MDKFFITLYFNYLNNIPFSCYLLVNVRFFYKKVRGEFFNCEKKWACRIPASDINSWPESR